MFVTFPSHSFLLERVFLVLDESPSEFYSFIRQRYYASVYMQIFDKILCTTITLFPIPFSLYLSLSSFSQHIPSLPFSFCYISFLHSCRRTPFLTLSHLLFHFCPFSSSLSIEFLIHLSPFSFVFPLTFVVYSKVTFSHSLASPLIPSLLVVSLLHCGFHSKSFSASPNGLHPKSVPPSEWNHQWTKCSTHFV